MWKLFKKFWHFAEEAKKAVGTALFIMFCGFVILCFFILVNAISNHDKNAELNESALLIEFQGKVPEKVPGAETLGEFINELSKKEEMFSVGDVVEAIRKAKSDKKIKGIVLKLDGLHSTGLTKLKIIAEEISDFKKRYEKLIDINLIV